MRRFALIRVLLVDDYLAVRQVVRSLLETSGEVEVVGEAADGEEALRVAKALHPDVVVTDMFMPGRDGYNVLRDLQELPQKPRVVMLSINDSQGAMERAYASGASAFVSKKSAHTQLVQAVLLAGAT